MDSSIEKLKEIKLLPVIKIENTEDAVPLAKALISGGVPVAEITFRTPSASSSIRIIREAFPNIILGAGTILTSEHIDKAIDSGASYLVSPGFNPKTVEYSLKRGITIVPGVCTPSEVEQAASLGLSVLKFFPAEQSGGIGMLKTFYTVYPHIKFIPTGGISLKNLVEYGQQPNVLAVGGSWMVSPDLIKSQKWEEIEKLSREAKEALLIK